MDDDDPWYWDVDRVVTELCTESHSWASITYSRRRPNPVSLEAALREQEIDGSTLLIEVDDEVLRNELGIKVLGQLAPVKQIIRSLRKESPRYRNWLGTYGPDISLGSHVPYSIISASNVRKRSESPPPSITARQGEPSHSARYDSGDGDLDIILKNEVAGRQGPANEHCSHEAGWITDATGVKRRKLNTEVDQEFSGLRDEDDLRSNHEFQHAGPQSVSENELTTVHDNNAVTISMADDINLGEAQMPTKKRKRIAPTLITSEIDMNRNREIPTQADMVVHNDPQNIEPGVIYMGDDGKKRLIPIPQSGPDLDLPRRHQERLRDQGLSVSALQEGGGRALKAAKQILDAANEKRNCVRVETLSDGYLGKKKHSANDIFYHSAAIGQEVPALEDENGELKLVTQGTISDGRRLYVHGLMKRFLRSEHQVFRRKGKLFFARRPYPTKLAPMHQSPSFTLFCKNADGEICATRENLKKWPEADPDASNNAVNPKDDDDRQAHFDLPNNLILGGPSSYDHWDPDFLEKWRYIEGGDTVLPLYGDSDEDGEYDIETWNEIEAEWGTLERPLLPLKRAPLTYDEVNVAIDEGIARIVVKWNEKVLPKLRRHSWSLWKRSRRDNDKHLRIRDARQHIARINDERLPQMRAKIHDELWASKKQVLNITRIMEQSIFDREERVWQISILRSKAEPEKPPPRERKSIVSKYSIPSDDESGERIMTETETQSSGDEDFIDDEAVSAEEGECRRGDDEAEDLTVSDVETPNESDSNQSMQDDETSAKATGKSSKKSVLAPDKFGGNDEPMTGMSLLHDGDIISNSLQTDMSISPPLPLRPAPNDNSEDKIYLNTAPNEQGDASREAAHDVVDLTLLTSDTSDGERSQQLSQAINPVKPMKSKNAITLTFKRESIDTNQSKVINLYDSDETDLPSDYRTLTDPAAISKVSSKYWEMAKDSDRLLIGRLFHMSTEQQEDLLELFAQLTPTQMWPAMVEVMHAFRDGKDRVRGIDTKTYNSLTGVMRLFEMYALCHYRRNRPKLSTVEVETIIRKEGLFQQFHDLCRKKLLQILGRSKGKESSDEDFDPLRVLRRKYSASSGSDSDEEIGNDIPHKTRKKKIFENAHARDLREQDRRRLLEQEERRRILQHRLAQFGSDVNADRGRIIINDAKHDSQGFVYVHDQISKRIKDHQIDGVRFMWSQIVTNEDVMQGCLLAHTMGLGKTMQVITLLVAIAEAAQSPDPSISSQIPPTLRESKTLILCPPSLIDNWMDELLIWAPPGLLGEYRKFDSTLRSVEIRLDVIENWYRNGGVLIMGYEMFRKLIHNRATRKHRAPLDEDDHVQVRKQLLEGPNIIIADEAHKMKNANASITQAAVNFRSRSRIALTGSPLANNIEEYHTMIEWIAPNYLGPIAEFRAKYVEPIQQGLWSESTSYERRRSLKMLGVLREDLAPKVHRADVSVLRKDLKPKTEFVITVPLTDLQHKAYSIYVKSVLGTDQVTKDGKVQQTTLWHWLSILSLLCNHPACFKAKLSDRKEDAGKSRGKYITPKASTSEDDEILDDTPMWKVGVSEELVRQEMDLFKQFSLDIEEFSNSNKVKLLLQILDASRAVGDKVLVFSHSIRTLNFLEDLCKKTRREYARLDGSTKMSARQGLTKEFNNGDTELYLISTTAGALGLNLPGANRVIIFDFKFNPINEEQAVGRAYRIGQQKPVFVYRFVAGGTFEESIHNKAVFKMQLASRVVDKKNPIAWAKKRVGDFLFEPKAVEQQDLSSFKGKDPNVLDKLLDRPGDSRIRAIVMTDTFERHDHDVLTAEELKEVMQLLKDEKLKRSNKPAWEAEVRKRALAARMQQHPMQRPLATSSISPAFHSARHTGQRMNNSNSVPQRSSQIPSIQPVTSIQPPPPSTTNPQNMPEMMPILGANTQIREDTPLPDTSYSEKGNTGRGTSNPSTPKSSFGKHISGYNKDKPNSSSDLRSSPLNRSYNFSMRGVMENRGAIVRDKQPARNLSHEPSIRIPPRALLVPTHKRSHSGDQNASDAADGILRVAFKQASRIDDRALSSYGKNLDKDIDKAATSIRKEIELIDSTRLTERSREIAKHLSKHPSLVHALISGELTAAAIADGSLIESVRQTDDTNELASLGDRQGGVSREIRAELTQKLSTALQATVALKFPKLAAKESHVEELATEIVSALAMTAKDDIAFEAAASAALKEATDHNVCLRLVNGSMKPQDFAKRVFDYSARPGHLGIDGSSDSPKSPFLASSRTPRLKKEIPQSPQAKADMAYLERVAARRYSRISNPNHTAKRNSSSSSQSQHTNLPNWALREINKANTKSLHHRRPSGAESTSPSHKKPTIVDLT